jgi:hypothetical protein
MVFNSIVFILNEWRYFVLEIHIRWQKQNCIQNLCGKISGKQLHKGVGLKQKDKITTDLKEI